MKLTTFKTLTILLKLMILMTLKTLLKLTALMKGRDSTPLRRLPNISTIKPLPACLQYSIRGRRLAVPKQTPTVTKGHLHSYSHPMAPTVTQQPPCYFFVKNYTFEVSFASLKSIYLEKDLRGSVKLAKNLYYSMFFPSKMQKWQLKERKFALLSNDNI